MRLGGLGFLAALAVACGAPGDTRGATWDGQIDTLADGRVVVRNGERGIWPEGAEWQVVEEIRIGTLEGEGPDTFGDVASFEVDNLGRIWVLDMQASELRVFDRDGEYVRTVGRAGSGPGEFRQPVHVDMSPDGRIWVSAPPNARISIFDTAGSFVESMRVPVPFAVLPCPVDLPAKASITCPWSGWIRRSRSIWRDSTGWSRRWTPCSLLAIPWSAKGADSWSTAVSLTTRLCRFRAGWCGGSPAPDPSGR